MNRKGVTLIELLIVIAIIGILAVIGIPGYIGMQKNSARTEAYTNLQNLRMLEEQSFADRGTYTVSLGTAGKDNMGNIAIIQNGGSPADPTNALTHFRPGAGLNFSYWIVQGRQITNTSILDGTNTGTGVLATCYVAFAQGNTTGRNSGETFAIDCNNNKNF